MRTAQPANQRVISGVTTEDVWPSNGGATSPMIAGTTLMKRKRTAQGDIVNALSPNSNVPMTNVFLPDGSVITTMTVAMGAMRVIALPMSAMQTSFSVIQDIVSRKSSNATEKEIVSVRFVF